MRLRGCLVIVAVMVLAVVGYIAYLAYDFRQIPVESSAHTRQHDGLTRDYRLYVPESLPNNTPVPLVMVLHGGSGTPINMERLSYGRFNELADENGFIVVYPGGIENHWNDGRDADITRVLREDIDDVGYLESLIDTLAEDYAIDRERVFATGISNGGLMSLRLACDSEAFAAVAPVTANLAEGMAEKCDHLHPIPMLIINGEEDPLIRAEGGSILVNRGEALSTAETMAFWRDINACEGDPDIDYLPDAEDDDTRVRREAYTNCTAPLTLYAIEGAGHTWPGGYQYFPAFLIGRTSRDINGADEIWAFFASLSGSS